MSYAYTTMKHDLAITKVITPAQVLSRHFKYSITEADSELGFGIVEDSVLSTTSCPLDDKDRLFEAFAKGFCKGWYKADEYSVTVYYDHRKRSGVSIERHVNDSIVFHPSVRVLGANRSVEEIEKALKEIAAIDPDAAGYYVRVDKNNNLFANSFQTCNDIHHEIVKLCHGYTAKEISCHEYTVIRINDEEQSTALFSYAE